MVLELLASSVDLSAGADVRAGSRIRRRPRSATARPRRRRGRARQPPPRAITTRPTVAAETVAQPVKVDNDLYVRDYARCILCYKCVEACGTDAQNTFAIAVAGRGFDARSRRSSRVAAARLGVRVLRQLHRGVPDGGAEGGREYDMREAGEWDETRDRDDHDLPVLRGRLHAGPPRAAGQIVKVTPPDNSVTHGHLCIKGRFGFQHVQNLPGG